MNNNIDKINSFLVSNYCVAHGKLKAQNNTKLSCHHYMFYSRLASSFFFFKIVVTAQLLLVIFQFNTGGAIWRFSTLVYSFEPINLCLSFNSVVTWTKKLFWSSSWCKNYHSLLFFALKQRKLSKHVCSTTNQTRNFCLALIQAVSSLCIIWKENWCFFFNI